MPAKLTREGDVLHVSLDPRDGSRFRDAKEQIKEIPGRRWDPDNMVWTLPADAPTAIRVLRTITPECDQELLDWITAEKANHEEALTAPLPPDAVKPLLIPWAVKRCPWQPEEVNDKKFEGLLDYQRSAVEVMAERARAVLADDMGLGKTLEAISAIEEWCLHNGQPVGPKLVIAPSSVKGSWKRELLRWLPIDPEDVVVLKGTYGPRKPSKDERDALEARGETVGDKLTPEQVRRVTLLKAIERNAWIVVNWEQLRVQKVKVKLKNGGEKTITVMKEPLFEETPWLAVVADEVHRAKNPKASQTRGLWRVQAKLGVMFGLTGTPIMNSPDELWAILAWLWPDEYGHSSRATKQNPHGHPRIPYSTFYDDYVDYYEDHNGRKVITGVKNPDALRFELQDKLIRRTAAILGLKGRRRIYTPVPLTPVQERLYEEAETSMWLAVEEDIAKGNKDAIQFARAAVEDGRVANLINIPNAGARLTRLQQIIENAALLGGADSSGIMDYFEERYVDSRPESWVFFTKYKMSATLLGNRLTKHGARVGVYTGDTSPEARTRMENAFQRGALDVIVGTIAAMKEGITLTNGRLMGFLTRDWVPDINEQCEARRDRLGQTQEVLVDIPRAEGTVATGIVEPKNRLKEKIVRTVLPKDKIKEVVNQ